MAGLPAGTDENIGAKNETAPALEDRLSTQKGWCIRMPGLKKGYEMIHRTAFEIIWV